MKDAGKSSYRAGLLKYCKVGMLPSDQDAKHLKSLRHRELGKLRNAQNIYYDAGLEFVKHWETAIGVNPDQKFKGPHAKDEIAKKAFGDSNYKHPDFQKVIKAFFAAESALKNLYKEYGLQEIGESDIVAIYDKAQIEAQAITGTQYTRSY